MEVNLGPEPNPKSGPLLPEQIWVESGKDLSRTFVSGGSSGQVGTKSALDPKAIIAVHS